MSVSLATTAARVPFGSGAPAGFVPPYFGQPPYGYGVPPIPWNYPTTQFSAGSREAAQAALATMGIEAPSRIATVLKNIGIFGGVGVAVGFAASLLPFIGPIAAAIGGVAGVGVGLVKGVFDSNNERDNYEERVSLMQQFMAAGGTESTPGFPGLPSGQQMRPIAVDQFVDVALKNLAPKGDGKILVSSAPEKLQSTLRTWDKNSDGTVTRSELLKVLDDADVNADDFLDATELKALLVKTTGDSPTTTPPVPPTTPPADDKPGDLPPVTTGPPVPPLDSDTPPVTKPPAVVTPPVAPADPKPTTPPAAPKPPAGVTPPA